MLELGVKVLLAYLLGSVLGSLVVGKLKGGVDIRQMGSHNPGGTNALRTQGRAFALWVMVIDVGKGAVASSLIPAWHIPGIPPDPEVTRAWLAAVCATAVVIGHCYPVWFDFSGGKGVATLLGAAAGLAPMALVPMLVTWFAVLALTGYVGLSSIVAAASLPAYFLATGPVAQTSALFAFGLAMAALVTYKHRSNIARMREGTEHRATQFTLLRRRR